MVYRGVILELNDKMALLIDNEGRYLRVKSTPQMEIGACVEFEQSDMLADTGMGKHDILSRYGKFLYAFASMAAVIAIVFSVLFLMNRDSVNSTFAYVDIDINPSMELKINQDGFITGVEPLNKDAEKVAEGIDFMGRKIENGVEDIIKKSSELGYFQSEKKLVLIAASINIEDRIPADEYEKMNSRLGGLIDGIETKFDTSHRDIELVAFNTSPGKMKQARENHMSIGRYSLYKNACNDGIKLALEDAKKLKIYELLNLLPSKDYADFEEQEKKSAIDEQYIKSTPGFPSDKKHVAIGNNNSNFKDKGSNESKKEVPASDTRQTAGSTPPSIPTPLLVFYNTLVPVEHENQNAGNTEDDKIKGNNGHSSVPPEGKSTIRPAVTPVDVPTAIPTSVEIIKPSHGNGGNSNNNGKGNSAEPTQIVQQTPDPGLASPMPTLNPSQNSSLNPGNGNKPAVTPPGLRKKDSTPNAVTTARGNKGNGKGNISKN